MIQQGDFVKLHYTGKLSDDAVFDTTNAEVAKRAGLDATKAPGPMTICVGQGMLLRGLDEILIGKQAKESFTITIPAGKAFGKKDPKLLKIIPLNQLHAQEINPVPGLRLNIDGHYGVVRSVASGRVVVDFNHPLASQDVTYDVELLGLVEGLKEQVIALITPLGVPFEAVEVAEDKVTIKVPQIYPQPVMDAVSDRVTRLTNVSSVSFEQGKAPENADKTDKNSHEDPHKGHKQA